LSNQKVELATRFKKILEEIDDLLEVDEFIKEIEERVDLS